MSEATERKGAKRREFLKLMGMGSVAGAAALAAGGTGAAAGAEPTKPETGYRETAHVRKFYETAKF